MIKGLIAGFLISVSLASPAMGAVRVASKAFVEDVGCAVFPGMTGVLEYIDGVTDEEMNLQLRRFNATVQYDGVTKGRNPQPCKANVDYHFVTGDFIPFEVLGISPTELRVIP